MLNCKIIVLFFALTVAARPLTGHHNKRATTCHRRIADSVSSSAVDATGVDSTASSEIASSTHAATSTHIDEVSATKAATSSKAEATSTKDATEDATSTKHATSSKADSTSSKTISSETEEPTVGSAKGSLLKSLFPLGTTSSSWTTANDDLKLSDNLFKVTKEIKTLPREYVNMQGKLAMKAHYPKGSYTFTHSPQGGLSFYGAGPTDLTNAREVTFGYSVFFPSGFDFNRGGKLPGIYGGNSEEIAVGCSGGRRSTECFSARLMWRTDGDGEMYTYLPDGFSANDKICDIKPMSECNPTYGASVARGSYKWATGAWTSVSERVKLNTPGKSDGELQLFVNGKSVLNVDGLVLRDSSAGRIRGIQMQTFFGGSSADWATPKDQDVYFSDFSVAVLENL